MFSHRITLFRLFGFSVKADASWLLLAVLVTWSLATGLFPAYYEDLPQTTYWILGALGAVGLFGSIVLHELGHSVVARLNGIPIRDITLFIFGGVADMDEEPPSAPSEFIMAVAGPTVSVLLAAIFAGIYFAGKSVLGDGDGAGPPALGVFMYLAWLNGLLAAFNLVPAFPLDGGRALRAILWGWKGDLRWSTRIASSIGSGFGLLLIVLGIFAFISGNLIGGVWWFMIGMFVRAASSMSYKQMQIRRALEGESLRRFMKTGVVTVPRHISVQELVEEYVYKFHYKMFPLVDESGKLIGCISTRDIKEIPKEEWDQHPVADVAGSCSEQNTVSPGEDPMKVLTMMNRSGNSRLLVVEDGELVGIVTLKDMLNFLSLKMDLEGEVPV